MEKSPGDLTSRSCTSIRDPRSSSTSYAMSPFRPTAAPTFQARWPTSASDIAAKSPGDPQFCDRRTAEISLPGGIRGARLADVAPVLILAGRLAIADHGHDLHGTVEVFASQRQGDFARESFGAPIEANLTFHVSAYHVLHDARAEAPVRRRRDRGPPFSFQRKTSRPLRARDHSI